MENKLPTAEEFYKQTGGDIYYFTLAYKENMKNFAKLHVEAALKAASEKVSHKHVVYNATFEINKDSILNSYPIENVK